MKINIILLIVTIMAAAAWTYCTAHHNKPLAGVQKNIHKSNNANEVSDFDIETLNGKTVSLFDYKGKVVLVHFWATWCAPCLVELPEIIKMAKAMKDDVVVIAISTNENKSDVERFIKKLSRQNVTNFIVGWDPKKEIAQDLFQTIKLPETFILSPNMTIKRKIIGSYDGWNEAPIQDELRELYRGGV